jgi:hypothetical protein
MSPLAKALRRLTTPPTEGAGEIAGARVAELCSDDRDVLVRVAQSVLGSDMQSEREALFTQATLERAHGHAELVAELLESAG